MNKVLEAIWQSRDQLLIFGHDYPVIAGILIFIVLVLVSYLVVTNVVEAARTIREWTHSTRGRLGLVFGIIVIGSLSAAIVLLLKSALDPVPIITTEKDLFLGEGILLKWKYDAPRQQRGRVVYQLQSARDEFFREPAVEPFVDGEYKIANSVNETRYWRVRAVDRKDHNAMSNWSPAVQITQYDTARRRIEATYKVRVFISNSQNQEIFKWFDGDFRGFDVEFAKAIVGALSERLGKNEALEFVPEPVLWAALLDTPNSGQADMIISSITKTAGREPKHNIRFSDSYYCTGLALVYRAGESGAPLREKLAGKRVGFQAKTTSEDLVATFQNQMSLTPVPKPQNEEVTQAILRADIDYGVMDMPFAVEEELNARLNGVPRLTYRLLGREDLPQDQQQVEEYAVAVRSGDRELLDDVNAIIRKFKADGTLVRLLDKAAQDFDRFRGRTAPRQSYAGREPWKCPD